QFPGDATTRQAVHTVYGGAQIFKADTAKKLGALALNSLSEYAPDFVAFAKAIGLRGNETLPKSPTQIAALRKKLEKNAAAVKTVNEPAWFAYTLYNRVLAKLQTEPVEDFRIDFEDGYGNRSDAEEDGHAASTAEEMAKGMAEGTLPPFIGIRVKPFTEELKMRGIRTLDIFISTLAQRTTGRLPNNFIVTIPKVTIPGQVNAIVELFEMLEAKTRLMRGSLKLEIMIETPQSIINGRGESALPILVAAAKGRLASAHFGVYDYTALCEITASYQSMMHPACDFARHMMKVALAQTGVSISDGATTVMPVPRHRAEKGGKPLTAKQKAENRAAVYRAWKMAFDDTNHSLKHGYYQGWDLHPGQLPIRYAAVYAFFLDGLTQASTRLKTFMEKAAQATLIGDVFDDAATGQGLLNFFLRGLNCGAITETEAMVTGLTLDELRSRSFVKILNGRRRKA
ncbi:MAG: phosphoenolpyruvate kinase, partial [Bacteroidota bacterium]